MKLSKQVKAFAEAEPWLVSVMANTSALLYETLPDVNWVGFYLMKDNELLIGPFQGKVACIRIPVGKGVCGTAVEQDRLIRVDNVHEFPGHIACDSASESEIVIPSDLWSHCRRSLHQAPLSVRRCVWIVLLFDW